MTRVSKNDEVTDALTPRPSPQWEVFGQRRIYDNPWVSIDLVDVEAPDGNRFEHHVVRMQRVAGAVVQDLDGRVLLLRHHRFITGTWGWEIPCGIVENGETSIEAAAREVEEETGFRPSGLRPLIDYQPCIGIADTPHDLFVATEVVRVGSPTDLAEAGEVGWFSLDEVAELLAGGQIHDSPTLLGLFAVASMAGVRLV